MFACTFAPGAQAVGTIGEFSRKMARPAGFEPATLGLEDRGSVFASSHLSRTLISARPPPRDEEMTPLGVRALSRPAVTAKRHARVVNLGRVFHHVGPFDIQNLDASGDAFLTDSRWLCL